MAVGGNQWWELPGRMSASFRASRARQPRRSSTEARSPVFRDAQLLSSSGDGKRESASSVYIRAGSLDGSSGSGGFDRSYSDEEDTSNFESFRFASRPDFGRKIRSRRRCGIFRSRIIMFLFLIFLFFGGWFLYQWRRYAALSVRWNPDADLIDFIQQPLKPLDESKNITSYELPLETKGRYIVDQAGRRFKLASINWYGASDVDFIPGGLDKRHRNDLAETIKAFGFNSVRLPYADEIVMKNPIIDAKYVSANPDLVGLRALDIYEAVTTALTDAGIAVIINNHITAATWCCGANPCDAGWANDHLGPLCAVKQTEEDWIQHWEEVMLRFVDNPLVIGADLRNEVRGLWGTMPWHKWAAAAEKCGNRLLKMKPEWLIVVEGTESANDLSGVRQRPVKLDVDNRLVYSAHVYAWSGWGSIAGSFKARTYESFAKTMRYNWGYILEKDIAPVWVGEIGASENASQGAIQYWRNLFRYLRSVDADFGYWAFNPNKPADGSRESYSLVQEDWVTPVIDHRMQEMVQLMGI